MRYAPAMWDEADDTAVGKSRAQMMQQLTEICARLSFRGIRPKKKREVLARLKGSGMQCEISK